jgi:AAA domain
LITACARTLIVVHCGHCGAGRASIAGSRRRSSNCGTGVGLMARDQTDIAGMLRDALYWLDQNDIEDLDAARISAAADRLTRKLSSMMTMEEKSLLDGMLNAVDLDKMTFPPLTEHVPGLVVEGLTLLVGPPKVGKSWLVGDMACGCAYGGKVLGAIPVAARPVLLVSLEDSPRRLQSRLRKIVRGEPLPARLDVLTDVNPLVVLATIAEWLQRHHDSVVVLDTLGKARRSTQSNSNQYQEDYSFAGSIKAVVDQVPGAALVAVHHTRKQGADDFLDTVSGTQGIAGAADSVIVLSRKRKSDDGVLAVTGRDIEENEYAVRTEGGLWSLDGRDILDAAAAVNTRREQAAETNLNLGTRSLDAVKFVNSRETTSPAELGLHLKIDNKLAGNTLRDLANGGYVVKLMRGIYAPVSGETRESGENAGHPSPANSLLSPLSPPNNVVPMFGDEDDDENGTSA